VRLNGAACSTSSRLRGETEAVIFGALSGAGAEHDSDNIDPQTV